MFRYEPLFQGPDDVLLEGIQRAAALHGASRLRGAFAYASAGGALSLIETLRPRVANWEQVTKRWLVAFDFGHTEPAAVELLASLPNSEVRVPGGADVVGHKLIPSRCFHPKLLVLDKVGAHNGTPLAFVAGSGNLTQSGLQFGVEAGSLAVWEGSLSSAEQDSLKLAWRQVRRLDQLWQGADRLTSNLLAQYAAARTRNTQRRREDDSARVASQRRPNRLTKDDLAAIAAGRSLWVETRNIYDNRGKGVPGNQLDLKWGTRVFFGISSKEVPPNSPLGQVDVRYGGSDYPRNLRYGDNGMDKLDLPLPVTQGPPDYANTTLTFERLQSGLFRLRRVGPAHAAKLRKASVNAGTLYRIGTGSTARRFGVV